MPRKHQAAPRPAPARYAQVAAAGLLAALTAAAAWLARYLLRRRAPR